MTRRVDIDAVVVPPRALTVLGELGDCCIHNPSTGAYFGAFFIPGRVLCTTGDGRHMWVLRPIKDLGRAKKSLIKTAYALKVFDLYERFQHRRGDEYYNCVVPPFRRPQFAGEMAIIEYLAQKGSEVEAKYVHFFEKPGDRPAFARFFKVGHDQFYFPPGEWRVARDGIEYAPPLSDGR